MGIGESDYTREEFRDFYGNKLRDGLYFAGDRREGNFYFVQVSEDGKRFLAESCEGFVPIGNFKLFAKQLIPLSNPKSNLEFALSKV